MSYILTEIALEMMGFKFYDVDGNERPINFGLSEEESAAVPTSSDQPTLTDILDEWEQRQAPTDDHSQALCPMLPERDAEQPVYQNASPERERSLENEDETEPQQLFLFSEESVQQRSSRIFDVYEKRKSIEMEKIIREILNYVTDADLNNPENLIAFFQKEKFVLEEESKMMETFLSLVENEVFKTDKEALKKYKRIFNTLTKSSPEIQQQEEADEDYVVESNRLVHDDESNVGEEVTDYDEYQVLEHADAAVNEEEMAENNAIYFEDEMVDDNEVVHKECVLGEEEMINNEEEMLDDDELEKNVVFNVERVVAEDENFEDGEAIDSFTGEDAVVSSSEGVDEDEVFIESLLEEDAVVSNVDAVTDASADSDDDSDKNKVIDKAVNNNDVEDDGKLVINDKNSKSEQ